MTTSKVEAEIQWLKATLFSELLKNENFKEDNGLKSVIKDNVKFHNVQVKFIGPEEAFMLTNCYRAVITFQQGDSGPKTTKLIVKRTPNIPQETFDAIQFDALFSNEILTYKTIIPTLEKFAQQTFHIPRFYYGDLGTNYAKLVLQDFDVGNWRVAKQKTNLSLGHTLVAIRNLATFHSIGFALRYKNRAEFDRITKDLKEARYAIDDIHPGFDIQVRVSAERIVIATKKYHPHIDEKFLERFKRLITDYIQYGKQMVKPVEPLVTLCHGDYLRNNIAFKYSKDNEEPIDSLMFDLQTMRLCSPMLDFATFLSLSCFAAVRCEYFDQIFNEYYHQLTKLFRKNTHFAEIPNFLSREALLSEYRRYLPYGISTASYFLKQLVEPLQVSSEEFIMQNETPEEQRQDILTRGGEIVDRELSHQMKELYEFVQSYGLDIYKGLDHV